MIHGLMERRRPNQFHRPREPVKPPGAAHEGMIEMLEVTIKNLDTGETLKRNTECMAVAALGDGGVYAAVMGKADTIGLARLACSMDTLRDTVLRQSNRARLLYELRDACSSMTVEGSCVDMFSDHK